MEVNVFTELEKQIMYLLIGGSTNAQIAEQVGYSERNVKRKIKKLFQKFNVNNRASLVREAFIAKSKGFI